MNDTLKRLHAVIEQELQNAAEVVEDRQHTEDTATDEETRLTAQNSRRYWRGRMDGLYRIAQAAGLR
jgi:hypothetical protein